MVKSPIPEVWTDARFKSFIVSALRGAFRRWKPKQECIKAAFTKTKVNPKTGRMCMHYKCVSCKKAFPNKEVVADHIIPIVSDKGFTTFDDWIVRGFVAQDGFQCMCKTCHKIKSKEETLARKLVKDKLKEGSK